jgi:hypothetical protein
MGEMRAETKRDLCGIWQYLEMLVHNCLKMYIKQKGWDVCMRLCVLGFVTVLRHINIELNVRLCVPCVRTMLAHWRGDSPFCSSAHTYFGKKQHAHSKYLTTLTACELSKNIWLELNSFHGDVLEKFCPQNNGRLHRTASGNQRVHVSNQDVTILI